MFWDIHLANGLPAGLCDLCGGRNFWLPASLAASAAARSSGENHVDDSIAEYLKMRRIAPGMPARKVLKPGTHEFRDVCFEVLHSLPDRRILHRRSRLDSGDTDRSEPARVFDDQRDIRRRFQRPEFDLRIAKPAVGNQRQKLREPNGTG